MTDKKNLITMFANADIEFSVISNEIIVPYGDTNTETVFIFDKDGMLTDTWSRRQYGPAI